jgi:hypothetical protein
LQQNDFYQENINYQKSMLLNDSLDYHILQSLLAQELEKFASDRVGLTDFALESAGARVIKSMTSPSFSYLSFWRSLFPYDRLSIAKKPETALNVSNDLNMNDFKNLSEYLNK